LIHHRQVQIAAPPVKILSNIRIKMSEAIDFAKINKKTDGF